MKKINLLLCYLCILMLLLSCGGNPGTQSEEPTTPSPAESSDPSSETKEATETTNDPKHITRNPIKAPEDNFTWPEVAAEKDFEFDQGILTNYLGNGGVVVIPDTIGGVPVRALGDNFARENKNITRVKIPEGIKTIGKAAFYFNENLEAVSLPQSLEAIDEYSFFACNKMERLVLPAKVAVIGKEAFGSTDPKEVYILGAVPDLGKNAFAFLENKERKIYVPEEKKDALDQIFAQDCIAAGGVNPADYALADGIEIDKDGKITAYTGQQVVLHIPEKINNTTVKSIGEKAFENNKTLRQVQFPSTVTLIEKKAFFATDIASFIFLEGLKEIQDEAFSSVHRLVSLHLPKSLEKLGTRSFYFPTYDELRIPEKIKVIPANCFSHGNLSDVYFPEGIEQIDALAFENNSSLNYLVFDGKVAPNIDKEAFKGCSLEDIDIHWQASKKEADAFKVALEKMGFPMEDIALWRANPPMAPPYPTAAKLTFNEATGMAVSYEGDLEEMTMYWEFKTESDPQKAIPIIGIANNLFEKSKLKRFYVPHSGDFTTIGDRAFADSSLEEIHLFDSVTTLGKEAFSGTKLKEIHIPSSVTSIGEGAFSNCTKLEKVVIEGEVTIGKDVFKDCPKLTSVLLPAKLTAQGNLGTKHESLRFHDDVTDEDLKKYQKELDYPWYLSPLRISDKGGFQKMPDTLKPSPEEDFDFDASTGTIKKYNGQSGSVIVPRQIQGVDVTTIGFNAFSNVTLASVAMGDSDNTTLSQIILPETITRIEDSAFLSCKSMEKFICYGPVEYVGVRSFELCEGLKEVDFVNGVKEMGVYTFNECKNLEKVNFNDKLEVLPEGAFTKCGFKGEVIVDYKEIQKGALALCEKIETLRIKPTVEKIGDGAFGGIDNLKKAYFEKHDASILGAGMIQFSPKAKDLKIILPATATEEQIQAFIQALKRNMFDNAEAMVIKE